MTKLNLPSSF